MSSVFTLLRLELAFPYLEAAEKKDPKALTSLAAIVIADEKSLKMISAGNTEILEVLREQVHAMPFEEVASLLSNFISGSRRFTLIVNGLSPEEALQATQKQANSMKGNLDF